jgi:GNAT superfamily N-acetyltransferase
MTEIVTYEKPTDFIKKNREYIYGDYFSHYHLIHKIEQIKNKKTDLFDCYNIVDDKGSNVLCMLVTGAYFIYSYSWTNEIIQKLSEKIEFQKIRRFSFCGQRDLIIELFQNNKIDGKVFKNRFIEVCESVNQPTGEFIGQIENGVFEDFEELVRMGYDYNQEEFRGQGSQTLDSITASVENSILNSKIFVWRVNGLITTFGQIINDHEDFAIIGSLYTKKEFRGKGYGYYLMHSLTSGLLRDGFLKCGLVSDADYEITKKIFERVGYKPAYKWVLMTKEER